MCVIVNNSKNKEPPCLDFSTTPSCTVELEISGVYTSPLTENKTKQKTPTNASLIFIVVGCQTNEGGVS